MGYRHKPLPQPGDKFAALTVLSLGQPGRPGASRQVHVVCQCGTEKYVFLANLERGTTRSCGCLRAQLVSEANRVHGQCGTRLYRTWQGMKSRCYNPNVHDYHNYGGRGITMWNPWRKNFFAFYLWATVNGYTDELTIDRVNNNKGYTPKNCRWVTRSVQRRNQNRVTPLTFCGETKTISEWAADERCAVSYSTFRKRLQYGWDMERALTESINPGGGWNRQGS